MSNSPWTDSLDLDIRARADAIEDARRIPPDLAHRLAQAGMFHMLVPRTYGGGEVHPREFIDTLIAAARADGAVGWVSMIGATTGLMSASLPEQWSQTLYGDNPHSISTGVTAPIGKAVVDGGGLRVTGRWPFGSGCQISDWICGGCTVVDNGEVRRDKNGFPEQLLVFFPADDVQIHDTWHTSGLRGTGSHDISVNEAYAPAGRWAILGKRARIDAPLYRFPTLGLLALGVSAVALGIAERAIEEFIALATAKVPTGSRRSLASRASVQKDLAKAVASVESARALTYQTIDRAWASASSGANLDINHKADLRLAASNNTWSAVSAVDSLYHGAGGSAIYTANVLQRCFRDVHVATQHIMVAQPTFEVLGKVRLGIDPKTML